VPTIVFYISGHGFGHAFRDIEVINAVFAKRPDVRVVVRTTAPRWLFDRTIRGTAPLAFDRVELETDTGVVQIDSLHLDEAATVARARAFMRTFDERVSSEAAALSEHQASLVVADIPALGIAAAHRIGVPAVALGNFTWDWIYSGYTGADDVVREVSEAYRTADRALRLPMHGGFASFERIVDIPFVARRSARAPEETRQLLGLPLDRKLVLLSFGGYGLERIDDHALLRNLESAASPDPGYTVIGSRLRPLNEAAMYAAALRYEDVVHAVDVVVSKPGYGIISECVANDTALLYTSRGHFLEYDVLVSELPRYLRARFIDHETLFAGRWRSPLDALLIQPPPPEGKPAVNGAEVAADWLLDMI
jgi:L-arabinokinase